MSGLLHRAIKVLDVLGAADEALPIRAIAERADLPKSAVQRLLADLVTTDMVSQDPSTRRYGLGPRTLAFGMAYQRGFDVRRLALPHMRRLRDATGETIGLSVGLGEQLIHIDQVECESALRARFDIGRPLPLWSGAPARLLLADRSDEEIARIISDHRLDSDVIPVNPPSAEVLMNDVAAVRSVGHACAFEETLPGVSTLSVPVHGPQGTLTAILSLTAPSSRLSRREVDELLPLVTTCAAAISLDLGWTRPIGTPQIVTSGS